MPKNKTTASKKREDRDEFDSDSSGDNSDESDFEDPDEIEVPGGGKNLKTLQRLKGKGGSLVPGKNGSPGPTSAAKNGSVSLTGDVISTANPEPGKSLLKQNPKSEPEIIDMTGEDDSGLEILKVIPGNSGGGAFRGLGFGNSVPSSSGFYPYVSQSLLRAQDPYQRNSTDILQRYQDEWVQAMQAMQNGGLASLLSRPSSYGSSGGINPYAQMSGGTMFSGASLSALSGMLPPGASGMLQSRQVSDMWMSPSSPYARMKKEAQEEEEAAAEDEDDMGVIETYSNYMPSKLKIGKPHPDPVVETASMASVEPPDVTYKLHLPEDVIEYGKLSALQLEAVTYACQQHERVLSDGNRAGYLIGDGAGVGKGRTIAGIIYENYIRGRKKAIWVSVSNDLKYDAERDLSDIGANIDVVFLSKMKYAKIHSPVNGNLKRGVIYSTYSALIGESQSGGKYKSRLKQLLCWCGEDFDGVIVFDECHRAKNLCPTGAGKPTKTGQTVLELQQKLPKARIVYASATGASEPKHMAYMVRLGIWGPGSPFRDFSEFLSAVEKRGVGAMEIVAMDMKLRGMYIARQLSFQGVSFRIDEVELSPGFRKIYDESVDLWVDLLHKFEEAASLVNADKKTKKTMWGQFWSSHQRFFKYLCIASKVKHVISVASEVIKMGKCVVIGLQSTGEARTMEALEREEELTDFVSTAKGVLQSLVEKHFPASDRSRVNKVLAMTKPKPTILDELGIKVDSKPSFLNGVPSTSGTVVNSNNSNNSSNSNTNGSNKRKPKREAAQRKKFKFDNEGASSDDNSGGSDFELSDHDDDDDDEFDDDDDDLLEDEEDDFNPFGAGSDDEDDDDPWTRGRKQKAKKKGKKKKGELQKKKEKLPVASNIVKNEGFKPPLPEESNGSVSNFSIASSSTTASSFLLPPPPQANVDRACQMKSEILKRIEKLGSKLPPNTLDQLIDELGGPENVAEMTGRKGRVVQDDKGDVRYESRSEQDIPLETLNLAEKDRFMRAEKDVAIISEAASSGISLQADRRVANRKRRVHMTLELPWSADRAIQQFGRTHRSNQVSAPEYILLISDLAGEHRFASIVAKRLESLGALTHGDRRATESRDLSRFNIDNKFGRSALEATFKAIMGYEQPVVAPPHANFFKDIADGLVGVGLITQSEDNPGMVVLEKGYNEMSKFLNRILGMKVELQNQLFKYFTDTLNAIVTQAKRSGKYDQGILDVGLTEEDNVELVKTHTFIRSSATGAAKIELHVLTVERGLSWDGALEKAEDLDDPDEGFYLSHQLRNNKKTAVLAVRVEANRRLAVINANKKEKIFILYRPNTGQQVKHETLTELKKKYKKVSKEEAEQSWKDQFEASEKRCSHAYWRGNCKNSGYGVVCEIGLRRKTYNVLAGSVLLVWNQVEQVLTYDGNRRGASTRMQVVRLKLGNGKRIVGTLIPTSAMPSLLRSLSAGCEESEETIY